MIADLKWNDEENSEVVNKDNDGAVSGTEEVIESSTNSSQDTESEEEPLNSIERIVRGPPVWMPDYVNGEGLSEEENIYVNIALFSSADPIYFEEVVKHDK
ncbi:hypothetical protein LguiA_000318 [Lonicera macranthoides]